MGIHIVEVDDGNRGAYLNLAQAYEAEFSAITRKVPGQDGKFPLDTALEGPVTGYLLHVEGAPAGLAAIAAPPGAPCEVCEFYVIPRFRRMGWGMRFAHALWEKHPGDWVVKQIAGAGYASLFWRKAIESFGCENLVEDVYQDPYWGAVTRQVFSAGSRAKAPA